MKELTTKDKGSLVALLEKHYAIKEKNFIDTIASNEEEKLNLTLKAYAIGAEQMNTPTNVPTKVVVIDKLCSKLQFVKAVKEAKSVGIKEAKDYADHMLVECKETFGQFYSKPFMIGDSMDSIFTSDQLKEITQNVPDLKWRYV